MGLSRYAGGVVVLVALLFSTSVLAATPASRPVSITLEHTPVGKRVEVSEGCAEELRVPTGVYRLYGFEEFKILLINDIRLSTLIIRTSLLEAENKKLEEISAKKTVILETLKMDFADERAISKRISGKWETCDKKLLKCKAGSVWPWIVAGVGGALAIAGGTALLTVVLTK